MARHELGPDAMLVNSKPTGVEARHLGCHEVVVCCDGQPGSPRNPAPYAAGANPALADAAQADNSRKAGLASRTSLPVDKLSQEVFELKQRMEKLALTLARSGPGMSSVAFDPELARAFTLLTDAELDTELAYDVVGALKPPVSAGVLREELAKFVHVASDLGIAVGSAQGSVLRGTTARVVALVGPPGAGKTSALVKLAVQYGLSTRKRVQILTTDTYRIAAAEELRSYAAILGIGCQVLETADALALALDECRTKDLILIDTPGLSRFEMEAAEDLARVLIAHPGLDQPIDIHLVLPASMRSADLTRAAEQYSVFQPSKLLFTRLDETETFGPILSRSVRMGKPISFFSRGQRIPEDLEPATPELLLDLVLGPDQARQDQAQTDTNRFDVVAA